MNYDFAPKYWTCPSCKSNNTTKHHHMWLSDLLHFTLYYTLFVPQTSNLFLNISYGSVFLKMCYIMWLWCHRNVTHMIELYCIRKDGGGGGGQAVVEKKKPTSCQNFLFCHPLALYPLSVSNSIPFPSVFFLRNAANHHQSTWSTNILSTHPMLVITPTCNISGYPDSSSASAPVPGSWEIWMKTRLKSIKGNTCEIATSFIASEDFGCLWARNSCRDHADMV